MADIDRLEHWRGLIAEQKSSGLSIADWCKERGVSRHSLCGWKTRVNRLSAPNGGWVSLTARSPLSRSLAVKIGTASIEVGPDFDPALLRDVVRALSQ